MFESAYIIIALLRERFAIFSLYLITSARPKRAKSVPTRCVSVFILSSIGLSYDGSGIFLSSQFIPKGYSLEKDWTRVNISYFHPLETTN